jgi:TonB family protein
MTRALVALILAGASSTLSGVPVATAQVLASDLISQANSIITDPAEYSAYANAVNQSSPAIRAAAIETFLQRYPNTLVKNHLLEFLMETYRATSNRPKTLATAERLLQSDPNNPRALAIKATIDGGLLVADGKAAADALDAIKPASMSDADFQKYREKLQQHQGNSLVHFRLGESFFEQRDFQFAAYEFRVALDGDPHPNWIDAWAHIDLGEIFDAGHQRGRAIRDYQAAIATRDDTDGAQAIAAERLAGRGIDDLILHRVSAADFPDPIVEIHAQYSPEGRLAELEGTVYLAGTIAADGSATDLHAVQPLGLGLDDAAMAAASQSTFEPARINNVPAPKQTTVRVNFLLSSRQSRWHLLRVAFDTPEGVSRPHFASAPYPGGEGICPAAIDSARLLAVMGRRAEVTLAFDVDQAGHPVRIRVQEATEPVWGDQAASFVRHWRFSPANKDGKPVSSSCTVDLVWGEKEFTQDSLRVAGVEFGALPSQRGELSPANR